MLLSPSTRIILFSPGKALALWLLVWSALLIFVAQQFELGVDEAHYVLYGLHLDWSYFDHPPLVGWVQFLFQKLPLSLEVRSRLPAILCSDLSIWLVYLWLQHRFVKSTAAFAAALLSTALLFEALSLFFLPDTLLLALFPAIAIAVERVKKNPTLLAWLLLGLLLGVAGLTKYTAILVVVALAIDWVRLRRTQDFFELPIYLAAALALFIVLPVLYWNHLHDWMSFKYQSGHIVALSTLSAVHFFGPQLSQWIGWSFVYFAGLLLLWRVPWSFEKTLITVVLTFLFFFALFGNFLPHWPAPVMVLLVPWVFADQLQKGTKRWSLWLAIPLIFLVNAELVFHFLPPNIEKQIFRDIQGWKNFVREAEQEAGRQRAPLAVLNWTFGSRFLLYMDRPENFFVLDQRKDQFDIWNPESPQGKDFLILHEPDTGRDFHCATETPIGKKSVQWHSLSLVEFELIKCQGFSF